MITLGLDIDETIIKTITYDGFIDRPDDAEFYFTLGEKEFKQNFALYKRPYLDEFMKFVTNNFNIFFYTRADRTYAEIILKFLKLDKYPLYSRDFTIKKEELVILPYKGEVKIFKFVKDLRIVAQDLGIDLDEIVFVDDVVDKDQLLQPELTIRIPEFDNDIHDFDLRIIKNHMEQGLKYDAKIFKNYLRSLNFQ
jgi:TFIIF-interacting CTD phosphatase-like protein